MRAVVWGVGVMGWNHARVGADLGMLVGIGDIDESRAAEVGERFSVPYFTDIRAAIRETNADTLVIATPTIYHIDAGLAGLEEGCHILVEKPIATTVEEGRKLVEAAEACNRILAVGQIERHNRAVNSARSLIDSGDVGTPVTISTRRVSNLPGRIRDVGVVLDLGIHDIDLVLSFMGEIPSTVFATGGRHNQIEYEDNAMISMGFSNGRSATVEVNWITPMRVRQMTITCDGGLVKVDHMAQTVELSTSSYEDSKNEQVWPHRVEFERRNIALSKEEPLKREWMDLANAIDTGTSPLVDGWAGLAAVEVANAALKSIRTNELVRFD